MTDYTKSTDFAAKDSMLTGNPAKIIKGSEFDDEFNDISSAIATKADTAGPTFTGTATFATLNATTVQIDSTSVTATAAELNTLDGITSTTAELNTLDGFTGTVDDLNYAKDLRESGVTAAEFDILDGLTADATELNILDGATVTTAELNLLDGVTATTEELNILDGVTSTAAELNLLDGVTATTAELNLLDGVTATTDELNYVDGVTSAIQTQIDGKIASASPTMTGTVTLADLIVTNRQLATDDASGVNIDGNDVTIRGGASTGTGAGGSLLFQASPAGVSGNLVNTFSTVLEVDEDGIDVTGTVTADGLTVDTDTLHVDATNDRVGIGTTSPDTHLHLSDSAYATLRFERNDTTISSNNIIGQIDFEHQETGNEGLCARFSVKSDSADGDAAFVFENGLAGTLSESMRLTSDGRLGVGAVTPSAKLQVTDSAYTKVIVSDASATPDTPFSISSGANSVVLENTNSGNLSGEAIALRNSDSSIALRTNGAEAIRINSDGQLLIGKTTNAAADVGVIARPVGQILATVDGDYSAVFSRNTDDGEIVRLRKGGSTIGSFGTSGGYLYMGNSDTNLAFSASSDLIFPRGTNGALRSGAINLGNNSNRFKDLHLSGIVHVGNGSASAPTITFGNDTDTGFYRSGTNAIGAVTNGAIMAQFRADGALNVGKTTNTLGDTGVELRSAGLIRATTDGSTPLQINRLTSNGILFDMRQDDNQVGTIQVSNGDHIVIGGDEGGQICAVRFYTTTQAALRPSSTSGANRDNLIDLGASSARWKDVYVGSQVKGGDGTASLPSYSFSSDVNTGMFRPAANTLGFSTNGAEDMRLTSGGDLHVDGNVIAYSTTISDRRLKSDITNISNALDKVGQINGVTFVRDHNGEKAAGVVAQEIMEVLPEAVKSQALPLQTGEQDQEYYVVEYDAVTGLLVEAVKELKARVEALEAQ